MEMIGVMKELKENSIEKLFSLEGEVAFITGGVRNLGWEMAEALAEAGAKVAISSREEVAAIDGAKGLAARYGVETFGVGMDVTNEASVKQGISKVLEKFGRLDIFVGNAGNVKNSAPLEKRELADWEHTFAVNTRGIFLCLREIVPMMKKQRKGNIILIASIAGVVGKDRRQYEGSNLVEVTLDYVGAKGAVIAMMKDLAAALGKYGIRVNAISPGGFERGQPEEFKKRYCAATMLGRMGRQGVDLKGPVVFLASRASDYITGHNLVVDGGYTAW